MSVMARQRTQGSCSLERRGRVLAEPRLDELSATGVLVDEVGDIVNESANDDQLTLLRGHLD